MMGEQVSFETLRTQYYTEKIHADRAREDLGPRTPITSSRSRR